MTRGLQVGARGVQRGRVAGRAAADDDQLAYVGHVSSLTSSLREAVPYTVRRCGGRPLFHSRSSARGADPGAPPRSTRSNMRTLLSSDGPLARALPGFREREAQLRMADAVAERARHGGAPALRGRDGHRQEPGLPGAGRGLGPADRGLDGDEGAAGPALARATCRWPRRRSGGRSGPSSSRAARTTSAGCRPAQVEARLFDVALRRRPRAPAALARDHGHRRPRRARPLAAGRRSGPSSPSGPTAAAGGAAR